MTMMINLVICIVFFVSLLSHQPAKCDYIRSDELLLSDDSEPGYQVINLNELNKNSHLANQFKLVRDTSLVNYVDLIRDLNDNTLVVLKKKINFENVCDQLASSSETSSCVQSLKIVAVNENDFIELPVRIQHKHRLQEMKKGANSDNLLPLKPKFKLKFNQTSISLLTSLQYQTFTVDPAFVLINDDVIMNKKLRKRLDQNVLDDMSSKIEYKLTGTDQSAIQAEFNLILSKHNESSVNKLKLNAFFLSQQSLQNAINEKKKFNYIIEAYLPFSQSEIKSKFGQIKNTSVSLEMKFEEPADDLNDLNSDLFKPLDFELPIYTAILMDNLTANTVVLKPKLKDSINSSQIVCSLTREHKANQTTAHQDPPTDEDDTSLPFFLNELDCSIQLKQNTYDLINELNKEEFYSFGIKATYKNLKNTSKLINYYYDYMIPAFAKIQIRVRHEPAKPPGIKYETILTRHELLVQSDKSQTIVLNINEPIDTDSKLIKLLISDEDLRAHKYQFDWTYNKNEQVFKFNRVNKNLIASNRIELADRTVYKTCVQVREKLKASLGSVLKEINLELRVDYDPLIFENEEYSLLITETNILHENLIRVATVPTKHQLNQTNIKYRIWTSETAANGETAASDANQYFQIDTNTGWIVAHKQLDEKHSNFELTIIASNSEQQKTASVKLKINLECQVHKKVNEKAFKFNVHENLPTRTEIATLQTICSNMNLKYQLASSFTVKLCSKALLTNQMFSNVDELSCNYFNMNNSTALFSLDPTTGSILTNGFLNTTFFMSSLQTDELVNYINDDDFKLKFNFNITARNPIDLLVNFDVDLSIQSAPRLLNFFESLGLTDLNSQKQQQQQTVNYTQEEVHSVAGCIYSYKYLIDKELDAKSEMIRFVRIDSNTGQHLQADFKQKVSDCRSTSFLINSNGCLTLRYDEHSRNCVNESTDFVVLKSGSYNFDFKLCYYDKNKVSCSPLYNQRVALSQDLHRSSQFVANILVTDFNGYDNKSMASSGHLLLKTITNNLYVLITLIAITAVTLLIIAVLAFKLCRYYKNRKQMNADYGLPIKKCIEIKDSELSNEDTGSSHSRTNINNQTETISNAATTSSKLSKTDDENDEIVKIRVSDDLFSIDKINQNAPYVYTSNNLGYAGSFSSIDSSGRGSSCISNELKQFNQIKSIANLVTSNMKNSPQNDMEENLTDRFNEIKQQGIYSVKNASIQYKLNQSDETDSNLNTDQKVIQLIENIYGMNSLNNFNNPNSIFFNSLNLKSPESMKTQGAQHQALSTHQSSPHQQSQIFQNKETNYFQNHMNKTATSSFSSSSNASPNDKRILIDNNKHKNLIYDYLKSKEVLLQPNEIIASVV